MEISESLQDDLIDLSKIEYEISMSYEVMKRTAIQ